MVNYPYPQQRLEDTFGPDALRTLKETARLVAADFMRIDDAFDNVVDIVSRQAFDLLVENAKLDWLEPVANFAALSTTYPNAKVGATSMTRNDGKVYRKDQNGKWEFIQEIAVSPINEVENRLYAKYTEARGELKVLQDIETGFDVQKLEPGYVTNLNPRIGTIMQWFGIEEGAKEYYVTQVFETTNGNNEHYIISRMSMSGELIDSMVIKDGGHGTSIGLERENGRVYIWTNLNIADSNDRVIGNDLVRFPYVPNSGKTQIAGVQRYNRFNSVYTTPTIDAKNGNITFRFSRGGRQVVELRKLADVKNGVDNLLGEVTVAADISYMQGVTSDGFDMYWYSGDTNGVQHPITLAKYDFRTGREIFRQPADFGAEADGEYMDDFREPEALYFYNDPETGQKALLAGMVVGQTGKRVNKIYAFAQRGAWTQLVRHTMENFQQFQLSLPSGAAKHLPVNVTRLDSFLVPGFYYMMTGDTNRITDHPDPGNAGWFLFVYPGDRNGTCIQELTRNSSGRAPITYKRIVTSTGSTTRWAIRFDGAQAEWVNMSKARRISDVRVAGYYYMSTTDSTNLADHPQPGVAGWFLDVLPGDSAGSVRQRLSRNSLPFYTVYERMVNENGDAGEWSLLGGRPNNIWTDIPLENGASHNVDQGFTEPIKWAVRNGLLFFRGRVNVPLGDPVVFGRIPSSVAPAFNWWDSATLIGTTGARKIVVRSNGVLEASNFIANVPEAINGIYLNLVIPLG